MKQTIIIASIIVVLFSIQTVYFINTAKKNKSQILDYYSKNEGT
jgi:branched-subunit amino acid transport protein AzlD